jgi:hypothetical protein
MKKIAAATVVLTSLIFLIEARWLKHFFLGFIFIGVMFSILVISEVRNGESYDSNFMTIRKKPSFRYGFNLTLHIIFAFLALTAALLGICQMMFNFDISEILRRPGSSPIN